MERVVYLLGAGFSAPLGLPIMSNFLEMSKDMYFDDPERYKKFKAVFNKISTFSTIKNYFDADLFNIEEILSILEMTSQLGGQRLKKDFIEYLSDVVEFYTPKLKRYENGSLPSNWEDVIFSSDQLQNAFGFFYATVLKLKISRTRFIFKGEKITNPTVNYALITLNYDRVLENFGEHLLTSYSGFNREQLNFVTEFSAELNPYSGQTILAKLHGSVGFNNIVPPTWSKGVDRKIIVAWRMAYRALIEATQIRVIGYSLPEADAYVKYLLKSAIMKNKHLKRFDVICLDDNEQQVNKRFNAFVKFPRYRFENNSVTDYIDELKRLSKPGKKNLKDTQIIEFESLEQAHKNFFGQ